MKKNTLPERTLYQKEIKMFKELVKGCMPKKGTKYSACVDLFAAEDVCIRAGQIGVIGLGVCIELDWNVIDYNFNHLVVSEQERVKDNFLKSHYLQLMLRSSLGKKGLILPNGVGVIDLDYKDEIKMIIYRPFKGSGLASFTCEIKKGDKIGQITLLEHKSYLFGIESEDERDGGFGSTGS